MRLPLERHGDSHPPTLRAGSRPTPVDGVNRWLHAVRSSHNIIRHCTFSRTLCTSGSAKTGLFFQDAFFNQIADNTITDSTRDNDLPVQLAIEALRLRSIQRENSGGIEPSACRFTQPTDAFSSPPLSEPEAPARDMSFRARSNSCPQIGRSYVDE